MVPVNNGMFGQDYLGQGPSIVLCALFDSEVLQEDSGLDPRSLVKGCLQRCWEVKGPS